MLLKYIFIFVIGINTAFAQMPNLKNNRANVPTDPSTIEQKTEEKSKTRKLNEGNIILTYGDIDISQTPGGAQKCFLTIKLKNSTIYPLTRLKTEFTWPSWKTPVTFSDFMINQENSITYRIPGRSCQRIHEKPSIAVSECIITNKSLKECGQMIKLVPWDKF